MLRLFSGLQILGLLLAPTMPVQAQQQGWSTPWGVPPPSPTADCRARPYGPGCPGERLGVVPTPSQQLPLYDREGRRAGTLQTQPWGGATVYDREGRRSGTIGR